MSTREAIDLYYLFDSGQLSLRIIQRLDQIAAMNLDVGHNTQTEPFLPVHRHDCGSRWADGQTLRADWQHVADWGPWCSHWYAHGFFVADRSRGLPADAEVAERYGARLVWNVDSGQYGKVARDLALASEPEVFGGGRAYRMASSYPIGGAHCLNGRLIEARILFLLDILIGRDGWLGHLRRAPNMYALNLDGEQLPAALPGEISRAIGGSDPDESPEWFARARFAADVTHRAVRNCFRWLGWNLKVWVEPTWCAQPSDPIICGWRMASATEAPAAVYVNAARAEMAGRALIEQPLIFATHSVKGNNLGDWAFLPRERLVTDLDEVRRLGAAGPLFWWNAAFTKTGEPLPGYAAAMDTLERYLSRWRIEKMDEVLRLAIEAAIRKIGLQSPPAVRAAVLATLSDEAKAAIVESKIDSLIPAE